MVVANDNPQSVLQRGYRSSCCIHGVGVTSCQHIAVFPVITHSMTMHKTILKLVESDLLVIEPVDRSEQVATLEEKTGHRFPRSFRQLLSNFQFLSFELGGIEFFGNDPDGLPQKLFSDPVMSEVLLKNKLIQVGRPDTGSYDPVCFNLAKVRGQETELVIVDHEQILINNRVKIFKSIAPSFPAFVEQAISHKQIK